MSRHCCTSTNLYGILLLLYLCIFSTSLLQIVDAQRQSSNDDDYELNGNKVSPSMALIVIVLVLGFFITGCIAIYIQQCSDNSSIGDPAAIARNQNLLRAQIRGLDQSVIETFPTFLYADVKDLKFGKESLECAICLNEFQEDETLRLLPKCDHAFHPDCIDSWLSGHTTCPVCRANLVPDPNESLTKEGSHHESAPINEVEVAVIPESLPKTVRVPRSHSTGHSLSQPGENRDRFTLRLPDEVRKQLIVAQPKLKRTISLVALPRVSSSKRGYRIGGGEGSGSSRYGRFFGRSFKWVTSKNNGADREGDVSTSSKRFFGKAAVTPVENLTELPV